MDQHLNNQPIIIICQLQLKDTGITPGHKSFWHILSNWNFIECKILLWCAACGVVNLMFVVLLKLFLCFIRSMKLGLCTVFRFKNHYQGIQFCMTASGQTFALQTAHHAHINKGLLFSSLHNVLKQKMQQLNNMHCVCQAIFHPKSSIRNKLLLCQMKRLIIILTINIYIALYITQCF